MAKNDIIKVFCFDIEVGTLGWDENKAISFFQYHPDFLVNGKYQQLIPNTGIIRRIKEVQVFKQFTNETFRGIPPFFADSLPDMFGNIIFKSWLESTNKNFKNISVIEQLAYVADRGMGALTYKPKKNIPESNTINIEEILEVLKNVLAVKGETSAKQLNHESLLTIFKIGTSAGGARPKMVVSEHKLNGTLIPGDINYGTDYDHYLVKLNVDDHLDYAKEIIEYCYYLTAKHCGINMMESKLVESRHFATKRFDRIDGEKIHVLTASGMTGWDFKDPAKSSYENLFDLSLFLKLPHSEIEELFRRMVFNVVFANQDDHLKNHSFIYNPLTDGWNLSPAYDITYSLNPLLHYTKTSRALSINAKRTAINFDDVKYIAQKYTIKNHVNILDEVQMGIQFWKQFATDLQLPTQIIDGIAKHFILLH